MSKFKDIVLDFNIYSEPAKSLSASRRKPFAAALCPPETATPVPSAEPAETETPVSHTLPRRAKTSVAEKTAGNAQQKPRKARRKRKRCRISRKRLPVLLALGFALVLLWSSSLLKSKHAPAARQSHTLSHCVRHKTAVSCQNKACAGFRGACSNGRVVVFDSKDCADSVKVMHVERSDGVMERLPAAFFRVRNSSMFVFHGKHVTFHPASCSATVESVVVASENVRERLEGHVVWAHDDASARSPRFKVYENDALLAEVHGAVLKHECNEKHCVYQFPIECASIDAVAVAVYSEKQSESREDDQRLTSFVFCDDMSS